MGSLHYGYTKKGEQITRGGKPVYATEKDWGRVAHSLSDPIPSTPGLPEDAVRLCDFPRALDDLQLTPKERRLLAFTANTQAGNEYDPRYNGQWLASNLAEENKDHPEWTKWVAAAPERKARAARWLKIAETLDPDHYDENGFISVFRTE